MNQEGSFAAATVSSSAKALASGVVQRQVERDPAGVRDYGSGVQDLTMDTEVRFGYLAEALATDRPALFTEQLSWLKVLCASRGVPGGLIRANIECMLNEVEDRLPDQVSKRAGHILRTGMDHFDRAPSEIQSHLAEERPHVDLARRFLLAVLETREQDAIHLVMAAFDNGVTISDLHEHVLHRIQMEIGRMWQMAEVTVAEEHYCTGIVSTVWSLLRSRAPRAEPNGKRVITASVNSESHDLGIKIVTQALELDGWHVFLLGADSPASALIDAARDFGCDLLALSVNIVLHVRQTAAMIAALRSSPETANTPILIGGQPFNLVDDLWKVVGADGHAASAMGCPQVAAELLSAQA